MWRRVAVRYSVAMAEHLVPWALLVAFVLGCVVGLCVGFYLVTRTPPVLHVYQDHTETCPKLRSADRVLRPATRAETLATAERASVCGANVCLYCLNRARRGWG